MAYGPYRKKWRDYWLRRVLEAQQQVRQLGPPEFRQLQLISMDELHEIRRIWLYEKHEFDDSLPRTYEEVTGQPFPKREADDNLLRIDDWNLLREVCGEENELFELQVSLLDIERKYRGMSRRAGIIGAQEERFKASQYGSEEDAIAIRQQEEKRRREAVGDAAVLAVHEVQKMLFEEEG